ncbi:MAG: biopolymer transporter ExbD [Drouetiella hepatica Uher 2000/2452]|jgi:biopolymer transport protein ExbD|uniref:Biopolymer transporter ExbD n=1 Tax=Drouetiella hepatica Uher 2000/2452 TaxID=904376 RepID=A0A951UNZ8_9CYAN|nr:biopolymer transporter ExbD [Drouetiella hepatica Uher 2000/2452]
MRLPSEPEPPYQINIVPMIDVIFAILTFFIMSTLYLAQSQGLPVNLPGANTAENQTQNPAVVTIDAIGNLAFNRQPMTLDVLEAQVRALALSGQQPLVVIDADKAVTHGKVVEVMDRLRSIDGVRLAIGTKRP